MVADELPAYGTDVDAFLSMKPGITGWWQVQARNDATYEDGSRQQLELYYVRNANLKLDVVVFLETFKSIINKTGV
ncbi:MAG: sugar transferase [Eggerthella lenta]